MLSLPRSFTRAPSPLAPPSPSLAPSAAPGPPRGLSASCGSGASSSSGGCAHSDAGGDDDGACFLCLVERGSMSGGAAPSAPRGREPRYNSLPRPSSSARAASPGPASLRDLKRAQTSPPAQEPSRGGGFVAAIASLPREAAREVRWTLEDLDIAAPRRPATPSVADDPGPRRTAVPAVYENSLQEAVLAARRRELAKGQTAQQAKYGAL